MTGLYKFTNDLQFSVTQPVLKTRVRMQIYIQMYHKPTNLITCVMLCVAFIKDKAGTFRWPTCKSRGHFTLFYLIGKAGSYCTCKVSRALAAVILVRRGGHLPRFYL